MTDYIKPECMPYYYNSNGDKIIKKVTQSIAYTADGYLLPCCWCDSAPARKDITDLNMYDEQLKLENNNTVEEILQTPAWKNFINIIMTDFSRSPVCCRDRCGARDE